MSRAIRNRQPTRSTITGDLLNTFIFNNNPIPQGTIDRYRIVKHYSMNHLATIGYPRQFNNPLDRDGLKVKGFNTKVLKVPAHSILSKATPLSYQVTRICQEPIRVYFGCCIFAPRVDREAWLWYNWPIRKQDWGGRGACLLYSTLDKRSILCYNRRLWRRVILLFAEKFSGNRQWPQALRAQNPVESPIISTVIVRPVR